MKKETTAKAAYRAATVLDTALLAGFFLFQFGWEPIAPDNYALLLAAWSVGGAVFLTLHFVIIANERSKKYPPIRVGAEFFRHHPKDAALAWILLAVFIAVLVYTCVTVLRIVG